MAKFEPMEFKLNITIPVGTLGTHYIDCAQICSLTSRKFVRQGQDFLISNLEVISDGDTITQLSRLPTGWYLYNAWVKAFSLWRESQDQVLDVEGRDILGQFADFKIFYDSAHQVAGVGGNLTPYGFITAAGGATNKWDPTTYQMPNDPVGGTTTEYHIHAIGPSSATSLGMIAGYGASRARPAQNDPNIVDHLSPEGWMRELFDVGENLEEIREDIEDDNDAPPYLLGAPGSQLEYYPGGGLQAPSYQSFMQDVLTTRATTALAMDGTGPFNAPCGLLRLDVTAGVGPVAPTSYTIILTMTSGGSRGLAAIPMQDVN